MKRERLVHALGQIEDCYITEAHPQMHHSGQNSKRKGFLRNPSAAAAVLAVMILLAVPVRAEWKNGYISNLLAPLYGGGQTELVDQIGVPVEAAVTVGDYQLSADAVIGDRYNLAIVYSLTRTDGGQLEDGLCFDRADNTILSSSGGGVCSYHLNEEKTVLSIVETWISAERLRLNRMAEVTFADLVRFDLETREKTLLQAGEWPLRFTIRYEDSGIQLPVKDVVVEDSLGKTYTVHKITISPIGLHLDLTAPNPRGKAPFHDITLAVTLDDGTILTVEDRNFAVRGDTDSDTHKADLGAMFDEPIPLERIREIVICGMPFPLAQ